jgi:tetratricopeptide (TPR) repeat protein
MQAIWPSRPLNRYYAASIAQKKNDTTAAIAGFEAAVQALTPDLIQRDSTMRRIRAGSMLSLAQLVYTRSATMPEGAERTAGLKRAADLFNQFVTEFPNDPNVGSARGFIARALSQSGDTAAVTKYSDTQLAEAGTAALASKRWQDGAKLLEAALSVNPYHRDALANLAAAYFELKESNRLKAIADTLLKVDPGNRQVYQIYNAAFQEAGRRTENAAQKKAFADSAIKYTQLYLNAPLHVAITTFSHSGARHTVEGTVTHRKVEAQPAPTPAGRGARPPAAPPAAQPAGPKTYTLKFEFLDPRGNVVGTQETTVGPVAEGETKNFTVTVNQAGVVAYRYTITS